MKSIVLFGGTFDPIHNGHLALCQAAYRQLSPESVLLIPSARPPHKQSAVDAFHRLHMCALATDNLPYVAVDAWELDQCEKNYSVYTATEMARRYPNRQLYWLMGADALLTLPSWYRWKEFCSCVTPLVAARSNSPSAQSEACLALLAQRDVHPVFLDWNPVDISSSFVRTLLAQNRKTDLLPPAVLAYIKEHDLYCNNYC